MQLCMRALHSSKVEVMHTQFRVSEDHKLRALLKKQSAKVSNAAAGLIDGCR